MQYNWLKQFNKKPKKHHEVISDLLTLGLYFLYQEDDKPNNTQNHEKRIDRF